MNVPPRKEVLKRMLQTFLKADPVFDWILGFLALASFIVFLGNLGSGDWFTPLFFLGFFCFFFYKVTEDRVAIESLLQDTLSKMKEKDG